MNKKALSVITATGLSWWGCSHADMLGCLIEPDRVADVGSQSTGVIEKLHVERGDVVAAGQLVARLSAQVERASLSVAEAKAKADAETQQAAAAYELARRKLERTKDLVRRDFVSDQALDQAEAEARVAEQRVEQARETQRVAQREFQLSSAQLSQREVRSPFAGLVVERYRTEGERIEREPVVRVARIDPLRIEAIVPAVQFGTIAAGQVATVKTDLPDYAVLSAKVTLVDRVIDPASNSFRVRLSLPNPGNRIPSGVRCRIAFGAADPAPSGAPGVLPPPSAAGQVAPARWPQTVEPPRPGVVTVSAPLTRALAHAAPASAQPHRFVSSTLKLAMAELGKTSPGRHWLVGDAPVPVATRKPLSRPYTVMAMTVHMPSLARQDVISSPRPVMADAGRPATPKAAPLPVGGVRLASVR
ncbi:efflux RND transporter periplasmic adaptor subunit [Aquabacterium sp. NJ1]|uniref:efflux RND transporter periplasmic adaptor subunit n=1 Tax=Aquabacterium sp. NJ1 TaxID=1538295 RepID=UPI000689ADD0|nr:efflux RND transporter periplasmic adaptor subunit [Aquabacterium sp. NJ1]